MSPKERMASCTLVEPALSSFSLPPWSVSQSTTHANSSPSALSSSLHSTPSFLSRFPHNGREKEVHSQERHQRLGSRVYSRGQRFSRRRRFCPWHSPNTCLLKKADRTISEGVSIPIVRRGRMKEGRELRLSHVLAVPRNSVLSRSPKPPGRRDGMRTRLFFVGRLLTLLATHSFFHLSDDSAVLMQQEVWSWSGHVGVWSDDLFDALRSLSF